MFKKLLVVFILLIIISITAFGQDQCKNPPTSGSPSSPGSPGGDTPDDNYSYSSGNIEQLYFITPGAVIFTNGYFQVYKNSNQIQQNVALTDIKDSPENLINAGSLIIHPTGSLFGIETDSTLKTVLHEYLRLGGTIIVFDQQYGSHIDKVVPIPEGESLHSYGWREDQSCAGNAGYFKQMHPALASMTSQNVNINVDGYFGTYPGDATVLLRRVSNQQPCLISYPYGNGTVILTSMYSDWGAAHSQASASELRLVRDLVTFAKNPNLAIPMYNLTSDPHPDISLNVMVKNESESAASMVKLKVYTPDRKTVLYETEASLTLAAGSEGVIPVGFNLGATLTSGQYGLCHTDYELYDAEGNLLQMATEADSVRLMA